MTPAEARRHRFANQRLTAPTDTDPAAVVAWLGAVQSQDYPAAKWALGQRLVGADDAALEDAFARGRIVRTHVLRPTWHVVAPADVRWMLALTAPRVKQAVAFGDRAIGLDAATIARSTAAMVRALEGGQQLTRGELRWAIEQAGVTVAGGQVLAQLVMHAELDALLCSGPRRGKEHTYVLLEDRVPPARRLERDEALAELVGRYVRSHGPATLDDVVWWSGLTVADARRGIQACGLAETRVEDVTHYLVPADAPPLPRERVWLLPNYDEYTVAYRKRDLFAAGEGVPFDNVIVAGGRVVGSWKRTLRKETVELATRWYEPATATRPKALHDAAADYARFLGLNLGEVIESRLLS